MSSQTNVRNAIFDQRSTRPPEVGVSRWHRHTDGHGDSMTNSAQWGRVGENTHTKKIGKKKKKIHKLTIINNMVFSPTWPHWAELVIESPCPSVCLCAPSGAVFSEASHWPSDHMIRSRPLIGQPPPWPGAQKSKIVFKPNPYCLPKCVIL